MTGLVSKESNHCVSDLERLFKQVFSSRYATVLKSGFDEPLYLPCSDEREYAEIQSTRDYFSSALHEVAHWCIAGQARRQKLDYGYWYEPDGRDLGTQRLFEKVEIKPQAMEWLFTRACGKRFRLSVDNVGQPDVKASDEFVSAVTSQARAYAEEGLPERAAHFFDALVDFYQPEKPTLLAESYDAAELR